MLLRARLREINWFVDNKILEPNLAQLLDLVALGTVADVAVLDKVNRVLVHQGLIRIRNGQAHAGINALIEIANKNPNNLNTSDLGFTLAPRLNAAGRMDDMAIGIRCLLTDDVIKAKQYAFQLDEFNNDRREVEGKMKQKALALLEQMRPQYKQSTLAGLCLYEKNWHQGVIGILAARIKDQIHRPVIVFASAGEDLLKGSARSITGVHIRDVISDIATQYPKLIKTFGGHAMAAGLSLHAHNLPEFALVFDEMVQKRLIDVDLNLKIYSDGELAETELTLEFSDLLQNAAIWGQGFPEPIFHGSFEVIQVRIVGQHHLKLVLRLLNGDTIIDAIAFFIDKPETYLGMRQVLIAYKLDVNEYRGDRSVQLLVQYLEKII
jgi:single-stranded-DNA-specific exonuclease